MKPPVITPLPSNVPAAAILVSIKPKLPTPCSPVVSVPAPVKLNDGAHKPAFPPAKPIKVESMNPIEPEALAATFTDDVSVVVMNGSAALPDSWKVAELDKENVVKPPAALPPPSADNEESINPAASEFSSTYPAAERLKDGVPPEKRPQVPDKFAAVGFTTIVSRPINDLVAMISLFYASVILGVMT
jgi:hypothetical protein